MGFISQRENVTSGIQKFGLVYPSLANDAAEKAVREYINSTDKENRKNGIGEQLLPLVFNRSFN
jgi:hypothetical protein